jgi:hypothetical protein
MKAPRAPLRDDRGARRREGRLASLLPVVSAVVIVAAGVAMTARALPGFYGRM